MNRNKTTTLYYKTKIKVNGWMNDAFLGWKEERPDLHED